MSKIFATKDISIYSLYAIFSSFVFETPIFVMYLSYKGIKYSEITLLFSMQAFAIIIFEYITGIIADKYTRKFTLMFSIVMLMAGELVFIIGNNIIHFAIGMILIAISVSARSGADTAYIYDKLVEIEKEDCFEDILSTLGSITLILGTGACCIGSFLTRIGLHIPFICTIVFSVITFLSLLQFREPKIYIKEQTAKELIGKSIKTAFGNKTVLGCILLSIVIFPMYHILNWLSQPYLNQNGVRLEYFGVFYTLITLFESIGTKASGYLSKKHKPVYILFSVSYMIMLGFILMSINNSYLPYLIPAIMGISFGIYYTINSIVVNRLITSEIRASLLSLQHALTKITQVVIFAVLSLFIDKFDIGRIFLCLAIIFALLITIIYTVSRYSFNIDEVQKRTNGSF